MKRGYVVNKKVKKVKQNPLKESELVAQYLDEKTTEIKCSRKIYSTYCPSCKSKTVDLNEMDETYCCSTCESIYKFASNEEDDTTLWFIKLRRA